MAKAAKPVPDGYHTITPQLTLDNAAQMIDWYKRALGAEELSRSLGPDGKVMHAEIKIGDSRVMVNDVMMGAKGPQGFGGSPAAYQHDFAWKGRKPNRQASFHIHGGFAGRARSARPRVRRAPARTRVDHAERRLP